MENNETSTVETETTGVEETTETNTETTGRTFTQEEVDKIVAKEKARAKKNNPSKEEIDEFNKWKESQKSESEKQAEREKAYQNTLSNNEELKRENLALKKGVKSDDLDYIIYKVSKMDGDFEENLDTFLKDNVKFTEVQKEETKATGTQSKSGSVEKESGVNAILRAKHPELFK